MSRITVLRVHPVAWRSPTMPLSKHRQSRTQLHRLHQNRTHAVGRGCTVMLYCTVLAIVLIPIAEYMVGSTFRESEPATPRAVSGAEPDELHPQMHFRGESLTKGLFSGMRNCAQATRIKYDYCVPRCRSSRDRE